MNKIIKRIFVASPSDTVQERNCVNHIVNEINTALEETTKIKFEVIKWETHSGPAMGRPQEVINQQLNLNGIDIFVGIIWQKFGTPTGKKSDNGEMYESGTQEEFETAYQAWKTHKKPEIFFFRSVKYGSPKKVDPIQLGKVNHFFNEFSHDKSHPGLYREYKSKQEFERVLRASLIRYLISNTPQINNKEGESDFRRRIAKLGFQKFFVPELNEERNASKRISIEASNPIYLIAHSGYSFLAEFGHRYRDLIEEKLSQGKTFQAILTNPWSESGFNIALAEFPPSVFSKYCYKKKDGNKYIDCIKVISHSKWYQVKYKDSLNGYYLLREKYGDLIQLRFTTFDIPSSVLLTDIDCYIEPYLPINTQERYEKGMMTFEVKISNESQLYHHYRKYFEFLWSMSDSIEDYDKSLNYYKKQLKSKVTMRLEE